MAYLPIHGYGIIGDMNSAALVSLNGSIDWACFPRFDSPSVFSSVLDDTKGGRFLICPAYEATVEQHYRKDTTILETTFTTSSGRATVIDFMTSAPHEWEEAPHEIVRIVRGDTGTVRMRARFEPRFDYARVESRLTPGRYGVTAEGGRERMALIADLPFEIAPSEDGGQRAETEFDVSEGQTVEMIAAYGVEPSGPVAAMQTQEKLARAERMARNIVSRLRYDGRWRDAVVRSVLTLHLLTYDPTGAIIAAPTTSLPEHIGGKRNWDYRFSWLRDSAWTVGILYRLGDTREGEAFVEWIARQCWLDVDRMQILYGISELSDIDEKTLEHLEGYRESWPVRIGNGAAYHRQLDVFGELVLSLATYEKYHGALRREAWDLLTLTADLAAKGWHLPDTGIWEVRGKQQHFVSSKVWCWVALDRAAKLAEDRGLADKAETWRKAATEVHASVLANGWSERKQSFTQAYSTDVLDASALLIPFVGFLPKDDPRIRSTVRAVQRELASGPFVRRYITTQTDDGLHEDEGCFFVLSFWLIGALLSIGERGEAERYFDEVMSKANHLGLFAEMWDPTGHEALGNFPQGFSHLGFLHTARNLNMVMGPEDEILG